MYWEAALHIKRLTISRLSKNHAQDLGIAANIVSLKISVRAGLNTN
jgi:hypothetical protein